MLLRPLSFPLFLISSRHRASLFPIFFLSAALYGIGREPCVEGGRNRAKEVGRARDHLCRHAFPLPWAYPGPRAQTNREKERYRIRISPPLYHHPPLHGVRSESLFLLSPYLGGVTRMNSCNTFIVDFRVFTSCLFPPVSYGGNRRGLFLLLKPSVCHPPPTLRCHDMGRDF